ncbi:MAG: hypothetical protein ABFD50_21185 [Smithella sp.]
MTTFDYDWLVAMNEMADRAEADKSYLNIMTTEQLSYLVYWNWGYSGAQNADVTKAAINELAARGITNYNEIGEMVDNQVEQYY